MKDLGSVLGVDTCTSSTSSQRVTSSADSDEDYIFTEDQRRAALELQSLYRKLGLEDLDDGFEEGLSAYDDPHFDIVARLQEVNTRFEEDETPLDSDRKRKVRFKETVVDLVVPISPVRSRFTPPVFDYGDYDDDYDDDEFEVEELRDMMADEEQGRLSDEEEIRPNDKEVRPNSEEGSLNGEEINPDDENIRPNSRTEKEGDSGTIPVTGEELSAPPLIFLQNGVHSEEEIHIRELEDSADDSDRSNCSSPEKILKLGTDEKISEEPEVTKTEPDELKPEAMSTEVEATTPDTASIEVIPEPTQLKTEVEESEPKETEPEIVVECRTYDKSEPETNLIETKVTSIEQNNAKTLPASVKPKKPLREISPPTRTRTSAKKPSALQLKPFPMMEVHQSQSATKTAKSGNSRSRYGLTEELREELRRLKRLEASQKKMKEQEQAEERRRRQEDAESAFRAWLDLKKVTTTAAGKGSKTDNAAGCPSPTRKPQCNGNQLDSVSNEEAFRAWLEQKHRQERRERLLQQLQRQHEAAGDPRRKDTSRKAYRVWLRRKNGQQKQMSGGLQGTTGLSSLPLSGLPQGLPRALQQAEMLNRTYQAYFGSSLWASLAGLKRHPATLI